MSITLIRIDDRLIHGQVIQSWVKDKKIQRIFVCNDEVAGDEIRKVLMEIAVPADIKISILSINEAAVAAQEVQCIKEKTLFLFTNPRDLVKFVNLGVAVKSINIGAMHFSPGKKQILETVSVDEDDVSAFQELAKGGVELEVRAVPGDVKKDILKFLDKKR